MSLASLGVVGSASATDTNTLVIPINQAIPRSDPDGGATIIIIWMMFAGGDAPGGMAITDDAPTDPFYSTHLYTDGMNPYSKFSILEAHGLILNPMDASNSITIVTDNVCSVLEAIAVAYTGAQVDNQSPPYAPSYQGVDNDPSVWFQPGGLVLGPFGAWNTSGTTSPDHFFMQWFWAPAPPGEWPKPFKPAVANPFPVVYPGQNLINGELLSISVRNYNGSDPVEFVPNDGSWTHLANLGLFDAVASQDVVTDVFELVVPTLPFTGNDLDGVWTPPNIELGGGGGQMRAILGGLGPIWEVLPPPRVGNPTFDDVVPGYGVAIGG